MARTGKLTLLLYRTCPQQIKSSRTSKGQSTKKAAISGPFFDPEEVTLNQFF
jgi:hypothetical protein